MRAPTTEIKFYVMTAFYSRLVITKQYQKGRSPGTSVERPSQCHIRSFNLKPQIDNQVKNHSIDMYNVFTK